MGHIHTELMAQVEVTNPKVEKLKAEVEKLQQQLIVEAKKTAEEKLRADQLDRQHTMQSQMLREALRRTQELETQASAVPLAIPKGWKLVPEDANRSMLESGKKVLTRPACTPGLTAQGAQDSVSNVTSATPVQMPEPFTTLVRKKSWPTNCYEASPLYNHRDYGRLWANERVNVYTEQQVRALLAEVTAPAAQGMDAEIQQAVEAERERICAAIKAEDDHCVDQGDYMLDSNDCIKIVRGKWVRPDYSLDAAQAKQGGV